MRITCPDCSASYDVPEALLAAGRPVRCARCSGEWVPQGPVDEPVLPVADAPPDATADHSGPGNLLPEPAWPAQPTGEATGTLPSPAMSTGVEGQARLVAMSPPAWRTPDPVSPPRPPPVGQGPARLGWALTALVLVALLWGGYAGRGGVMQAWPPSIRLYAALGLAGR